jgi:hypothetical protein
MMRIATNEAKATVISMNIGVHKFRNQNCQTKIKFLKTVMTELNIQGRKNSPATCHTQDHYHLAQDDNMKTQNLLKSQPHKSMSKPIAHLAHFSLATN